MNKLIFGLVGFVVILASCSNSAGSPALGTVPTAAPTQQETTTPTQQEVQYPKKSTVYQEDNSGTHKVDFTDKVNLTGYHEIPKDSEYGVNWVYISKSTYDKKLTEVNPKYKYVAIRLFEFNYENTLGHKLSCKSDVSENWEAFYKCIPYLRDDVSKASNPVSELILVLSNDGQERLETVSIGYRVYSKTETENEKSVHSAGDINIEKYFPEWKYLEH